MSDIRPINIRAEFSSDRKYRYLWEAQISNQSSNGKPVTFLMLNPSTADEIFTDRTIDICLKYVTQLAKWRYSALRVVNLFAYRTKDPNDLLTVLDPIGLHNNSAILHAVSDALHIVCAWGDNGRLLNRADEVRKLLKRHRERLYCLGCNGSGEPTHPLSRKNKLVLKPYDPWSCPA